MIKWTEKTVKVSDLKPFEHNHRNMAEKDYERLKKKLVDNGYPRVIATKDLREVGGHQRIKVLRELGINKIPALVRTRVSVRTREQFRRVLHPAPQKIRVAAGSFRRGQQ